MKHIVRALAMLGLSWFVLQASAYSVYPTSLYSPRMILWGLAGSDPLGRGDILFPVRAAYDSLLYLNVQGEYGDDREWYAGLGTGFRKIANNRSIYGAYLFLDRNESRLDNQYWILSPGLEALYCDWDFRANGYIPVSEKRKRGTPFFLTGLNDCGINQNCDLVEFRGHQQFAHRFVRIEEVGPGGDLEVGYRFPHFASLELHAGVYYYHFEDVDHIKGVEGRVELPIGNGVLTAEASYDNEEHGKVVAGLEFRFGQPRSPVCCCDIRTRLLDRVARNLGTTGRGTGVPIVRTTKDEGLFLFRDNIYFFTASNGTVFSGTTTGTIENPLAADQFNQSTLDALAAIAPNANLYFSPGTYTILPGPNNRVALHNGQSLYGRSSDYKCSAVGLERPLFIGGFDLFEGNNTLDSIRLLNEATDATGTGSVIVAINIDNASGIHICNSEITASTIVLGNLVSGNANSATGIHSNNGGVEIDRSQIFANALVTGSLDIFSANFATAIGAVADDLTPFNTFNNNIFTIRDSLISARTEVLGDANAGGNLVVGIGNVAGATDLSTVVNAQFNFNTFNLFNTVVNATAIIRGANVGINVGGNFIESDNMSVGIGSNSFHTNTGIDSFDANNFLLSGSTVNSSALLITTNEQSLNYSVGIGSMSGFKGTSTFDSNNFILTQSAVNSIALITGNNSGVAGQLGVNNAVGIGDVAFIDSSSTFNSNIFRILDSTINAVAIVGQNNSFARNTAIGIGPDSLGPLSSAIFNNNDFILNNVLVDVNATVRQDNINASANNAIGIGAENTSTSLFENNNFLINQSTINVLALIGGDNIASINRALGLFAGNLTTIDIRFSQVNVSAIVNGTQAGTNIALATQTVGTGVIIPTGTVFNVVTQP